MLKYFAFFVVAIVSQSIQANTQYVLLTPTMDSEITIDEFSLKFNLDGTRTLSGTGLHTINDPDFFIEFMVDVKNKTYRATRKDFDDGPVMEADYQNKVTKVNSDPVALKVLVSGQEVNTNPVNTAVSPGHWAGRVRVRTKDIPQWTITETYNELSWYTDNDGKVCWTQMRLKWFAINPSPVDTHWFIEDSGFSGPLYMADNTQIYLRTNGDYYNFDWGLDSWKTSVSQSATITARNDAKFNYTWTHNDSGEDALLIWGTVLVN